MNPLTKFTKRVFILVAITVPLTSKAVGSSEPRDTVQLEGSRFELKEGEVKTLEVPGGWRKVDKIFVQSFGKRSQATFEVIANGDVKGTVLVPGQDPSYIVTIGEVTRSLQFRHIRGATAEIIEVKAVVSERALSDKTLGEEAAIAFPVKNQSTHLSRRAIHLVNALEPYSNYDEYGDYLLPIKKVAARAYAVGAARGDMSSPVRKALMALEKQIEFAAPYLDETYERTAAFDLAVELTELGIKIETLVH